jgi:deoxyribonuclease-4
VWRQRPLPPEETAAFRRAAADAGLEPVVVHAPYLLNLAAPDDGLWQRSIAALAEQLARAASLGAAAVVVHPGSRGPRSLEWGLERTARGVEAALEAAGGGRRGPGVWLENTAGGGASLGRTLSQLAWWRRRLAGRRVGFCLDTAHAFAAGYHLESPAGVERFLARADGLVGLEAVRLWHLNDTVHPRSSRRDQHAHLGRGLIGPAGLGALVRHRALAAAPAVMETPKPSRWADRRNLAYARRLAAAALT